MVSLVSARNRYICAKARARRAAPVATVTEFAPFEFWALRRSFGLLADPFCEDLASAKGTRMKISGGRSGAFMFFTKNRRFVCKTMPEEEARLLLGFLPQYVSECSSSFHEMRSIADSGDT